MVSRTEYFMVYFLFVESNANLSLEVLKHISNIYIDGFQSVFLLVLISMRMVGEGRKVIFLLMNCCVHPA